MDSIYLAGVPALQKITSKKRPSQKLLHHFAEITSAERSIAERSTILLKELLLKEIITVTVLLYGSVRIFVCSKSTMRWIYHEYG